MWDEKMSCAWAAAAASGHQLEAHREQDVWHHSLRHSFSGGETKGQERNNVSDAKWTHLLPWPSWGADAPNREREWPRPPGGACIKDTGDAIKRQKRFTLHLATTSLRRGSSAVRSSARLLDGEEGEGSWFLTRLPHRRPEQPHVNATSRQLLETFLQWHAASTALTRALKWARGNEKEMFCAGVS